MRIGNCISGRTKLQEAVDALHLAWSDATEHWRDDTARNIEENHLVNASHILKETIEATGHFQDIVFRAFRDCSPDKS